MPVKTLTDLSIPEESNILFAGPDFSRWPTLVEANKALLNRVSGRDDARCELLGVARHYTKAVLGNISPEENYENIVVTGHQAVWHHGGILAKDCMAHLLAKGIGGCGVHLVLDHDIRDTSMILPERGADHLWSSRQIDLETGPPIVPLELRPIPSRHKVTIFRSMVGDILSQMVPDSLWNQVSFEGYDETMGDGNIADFITSAQAQLKQDLSISMLYLPVSRLAESNAFLSFILSILKDAKHFAGCYNRGVLKQKYPSDAHETIRNLVVDTISGIVELPFWIFLPDGRRLSLYIKSTKDIELYADMLKLGCLNSSCEGGQLEHFRDILRQNKCRLRPKAVSLTLFTRLFLADWFIHGIGGAFYEVVTDDLIRNYYQLGNVKFGVTTASIKLPLPETSLVGETISQIKYRLHNIRHCPERYLEEDLLEKEALVFLVRNKQEFIRQAGDRSVTRDCRLSAWTAMKEINRQLFRYVEKTYQTLVQKKQWLEKQELSQQVCNSREYFFGLFSREALLPYARCS